MLNDLRKPSGSAFKIYPESEHLLPSLPLPLWTEPLLPFDRWLQWPQPVSLWPCPLQSDLSSSQVISLSENPLRPLLCCRAFFWVSVSVRVEARAYLWVCELPQALTAQYLLWVLTSSSCPLTAASFVPGRILLGSLVLALPSLNRLLPRYLPAFPYFLGLCSYFTWADSSPLALPVSLSCFIFLCSTYFYVALSAIMCILSICLFLNLLISESWGQEFWPLLNAVSSASKITSDTK